MYALLGPNTITSALPSLKFRRFKAIHDLTSSLHANRGLKKDCYTIEVGISGYHLRNSGRRHRFFLKIDPQGISRKSINKIGPRIEPCGTP